MIDPDDREFFSWDPELPDPESEPDQAPATYGFLATVPLEIKREQFRALNNVLSDFRISDLFTTASQVRWAAGVIKLGLQLPIEDLDLISDALSQNSELLYTLHEIDFSHEKSDLSPEALQLLLAKSTTTVIRRLGVLFNPRPFFWDQMPTREIVHQSNQRVGKITESCITMPKPLSSQNTPTAPTSLRRTLSAKGALLRVTSARSGKLAQSATPTQEDIAGREVGDQKDKAEQHALEDGSELTNIGEMWGSSWEDMSGAANEDDLMADEQWLEVIGSQDDAGDSGPSSLQPPLKGSSMPPPSEPIALTTMQGDASTGIQPIHNTPGLPKTHVDDETLRERQKARLRRAAALWEGYVELLHRAIQVFLAVLEHNQPDVYCEELSSLHLWFVAIIDLVLSQGGNSPRLDPWAQRYRPHIGLEIWDITWATLGDRLEDVALTFAVAVWGRLVSTENIDWRYMKNFTYWIHREKAMREWLKIVSDLSVCVMRLHYASNIAFKEYAESRPPNLLDTLNNLSSHSAEALLYYYMTVPLDTRMIPPNTYYTYVMEVCEIVNRMLDIEKVVVVDEVVHLQRPPSANYILFYFGTPLFFMARAETDGTSESATAKTQALVVLSRVLATEAQPEDPIHQKYRDRILRVLYEVFHKDSQAQIILPSVQLLLNKTAYIRPLIPDIVILSVREMQLVSSLLSQRERCARRRQAVAVYGSLIAFPWYYRSLGILEKVDKLHRAASFQIDRAVFQLLGDEWSNTILVVDKLKEQIADSKFTDAGEKNMMFNMIVEHIFTNLMISLATETDDLNLRLTSSMLLLFLHQYGTYNPGYVNLYLRFLIDQLRESTRMSTSIVYLYALTMGASLTWEGHFEYAQQEEFIFHLVKALSDCDRYIYRYSQWDRYHQLLITSIRCLNTWMGLSFNHIHRMAETKKILVGISERLDKYLKTTEGYNAEEMHAVGRLARLNIATANHIIARRQDDSTVVVDEATYVQRYPKTQLRELDIVSVTSLSLFNGTKGLECLSTGKGATFQKTHRISPSLYRVLFTTLASFNTTLSLAFEQAWPIPSRDRPDIMLTRVILCKENLPDNSTLLGTYHPDVLRMLDGFKPVSVSWYSSFRRSLYSEISFENTDGEPGNNTLVLVTARYPSTTRYWIMKPGDPISSDMLDDARVASMLASERTTEGAGGTAEQSDGSCIDHSTMNIQKREQALKYGQHSYSHNFKPLIDMDGHMNLVECVREDYINRCVHSRQSVIPFPAACPRNDALYNNQHFRMCIGTCHTGDISFIKASTKLLEDIDRLDDLSMPFIAHAVIMYLESYENFLTHPTSARAPLRCIGSEFSQFLNQLGRGKLKPLECMKRNTDDAFLLKYKFWADNTEVSYYLAPNISALVGNRQMDNDHSEVFCSRLYSSGISVVWLNDSPHSADMAHLWKLIDTANRRHEDKTNEVEEPKESKVPEVPEVTVSIETPKSSKVKRTSSTTPRRNEGVPVSPARTQRRSYTKKTNGRTAVTRKRTLKTQATEKAPTEEQKKRSGSSSTPAPPLRGRRRARDILRKAIRRHRDASTLGTNESDSMASRCSSVARASEKPAAHPSETQDSSPLLASAQSAEADIHATGTKEQSQNDPPFAGKPDQPKQPATSDDKAADARVRFMIVLAPVKDTSGQLIKVWLSAVGSTERMNEEFVKMTGPLQPEIIVQAKSLANIISITVLDAAANMASLTGDDFSAILRRRVMIASIIDEHCSRYKTVEEAEKALYPVGQSGMEPTMVYSK